MLDRLRALFKELEPGPKTGQGNSQLAPDLAAAALMFEVVWADHDISAEELDVMGRRLEQLFGIDKATTDALIKQTRTDHANSVGVFPYTRALNDAMTEDEKVAVIEAMWSIAYADEGLGSLEEHAIRRIADLLYVPHRRFIEAKQRARISRQQS
jgi:uncharacterized tellurite resistance protein B-like protein